MCVSICLQRDEDKKHGLSGRQKKAPTQRHKGDSIILLVRPYAACHPSSKI
jgi:hypothetical protein